jgi:Glycosyl hydrolases family 16
MRSRKLAAASLMFVLALISMVVSAHRSDAATNVAQSGSEDPSGVAMPTTPPPGGVTVYAQDFLGSALPSGWGAYTGRPGGDPNGCWNADHVGVGGGLLRLAGYWDTCSSTRSTSFVTGGVSSGVTMTYGEWLVRAKMDPGAGVSDIALLWPSVGWPPEVDFYEDSPVDNTRTWTGATLHYSSSNLQLQDNLIGWDFTQWHTYGVIWWPGGLQYTIDGSVWATMYSSGVPKQPMTLAFQQTAMTCTSTWPGCPNATTPSEVDMNIDWVVAYQADY